MKSLKKTIGFALTGSFCTLDKAFEAMKALREQYTLLPIVSETVMNTDTRFFSKEAVRETLSDLCGRKPLCSIPEAEPIGPKKMLDLLVVCPCTGNTLSKIACGITDSCVTMAVKSHRRNGRNVLIALSSNDALSGSAENLGRILNRKGFFFVPMHQDAPWEKPFSLQCDFSRLPDAVEAALANKQTQPLFF